MPTHSLTKEDILYLEAKRKRYADFKRHEADLAIANEKHRKMMENTDDSYYEPESNNETYSLMHD